MDRIDLRYSDVYNDVLRVFGKITRVLPGKVISMYNDIFKSELKARAKNNGIEYKPLALYYTDNKNFFNVVEFMKDYRLYDGIPTDLFPSIKSVEQIMKSSVDSNRFALMYITHMMPIYKEVVESIAKCFSLLTITGIYHNHYINGDKLKYSFELLKTEQKENDIIMDITLRDSTPSALERHFDRIVTLYMYDDLGYTSKPDRLYLYDEYKNINLSKESINYLEFKKHLRIIMSDTNEIMPKIEKIINDANAGISDSPILDWNVIFDDYIKQREKKSQKTEKKDDTSPLFPTPSASGSLSTGLNSHTHAVSTASQVMSPSWTPNNIQSSTISGKVTIQGDNGNSIVIDPNTQSVTINGATIKANVDKTDDVVAIKDADRQKPNIRLGDLKNPTEEFGENILEVMKKTKILVSGIGKRITDFFFEKDEQNTEDKEDA